MNIIQFIERILIDEFRIIQQEQSHHYLSFGLISQGIEFLGSLTDEYDFDTKEVGASSGRFKNSLKEFFPKKYAPFADKDSPYNLYKNLRCGMLHIIIPTTKLALGERRNEFGKNEHLKTYKDDTGKERLFLMSEDFYDDFRCACTKVIDLVADGSIFTSYPKLNDASEKKQKIIHLKRDLLNTEMELS